MVAGITTKDTSASVTFMASSRITAPTSRIAAEMADTSPPPTKSRTWSTSEVTLVMSCPVSARSW